jgi:putative transposase
MVDLNVVCHAEWATRWKPALNAFAITFDGRVRPTGN